MSARLAHLADRLAADPSFIAGHVTTAALAAALGCDETDAVRIRLCRAPRSVGDLRLIAERFGLDSFRLGDALAGQP